MQIGVYKERKEPCRTQYVYLAFVLSLKFMQCLLPSPERAGRTMLVIAYIMTIGVILISNCHISI